MAKLFPNNQATFIFGAYIGLFVASGLLIVEAKRRKLLGLNQILIVLLTEIFKLIICSVLYLLYNIQGSCYKLLRDLYVNRNLFILYLIPALLYCIYNNLTFINLQLIDATTYYCLLQFRIVLIALIYQILFKRQLTFKQWTSLGVLTIGCLVMTSGSHIQKPKSDPMNQRTSDPIQHISVNQQQINSNTTIHHVKKNLGQNDIHVRISNLYATNHTQSIGLNRLYEYRSKPIIYFLVTSSLIFLQMFCSCFAGVYNEYLLKDSTNSKNANVMLQNIYMYLDSLLCNGLIYWFAASSSAGTPISHHGNYTTWNVSFSPSSLAVNNDMKNYDILKGNDQNHGEESLAQIPIDIVRNPLIILIVLINSLSGLVASLFLKNLNSVLKTFASAIELFAIAFLTWLIFDDSIDSYTIIALILVSVALYLYSKEPVSVESSNNGRSRDGFQLLKNTDDVEDVIIVNHDDDQL